MQGGLDAYLDKMDFGELYQQETEAPRLVYLREVYKEDGTLDVARSFPALIRQPNLMGLMLAGRLPNAFLSRITEMADKTDAQAGASVLADTSMLEGLGLMFEEAFVRPRYVHNRNERRATAKAALVEALAEHAGVSYVVGGAIAEVLVRQDPAKPAGREALMNAIGRAILSGSS